VKSQVAWDTDKRLEVPQCQQMLVIALEGHCTVGSMSIFSKASQVEEDPGT